MLEYHLTEFVKNVIRILAEKQLTSDNVSYLLRQTVIRNIESVRRAEF